MRLRHAPVRRRATALLCLAGLAVGLVGAVPATVGAAGFQATVTLGNGQSFTGAGQGAAVPSSRIALGVNVGFAGQNPSDAALCFVGSLDPAKVAGKIIVCDRGVTARVDKAEAVRQAGGVGAVLANTSPNNVVSDPTSLPMILVDNVSGAAIKLYVNGTADPTASFSAGVFTGPQLTELSPVHVWVGLKNGDDQGTQFDVRAEMLRNGSVVASGLTQRVTGVTRNTAAAKEVVVDWVGFSPVDLADGDVLSIRLSTRIGTTATGAKCTGPGGAHNSAVGLRAYYDATTRNSRFDATISPSASRDMYLHSNGTACGASASTGVTSRTADTNAPTAASAKCADSAALSFSGGNAFKVISTWDLSSGPSCAVPAARTSIRFVRLSEVVLC